MGVLDLMVVLDPEKIPSRKPQKRYPHDNDWANTIKLSTQASQNLLGLTTQRLRPIFIAQDWPLNGELCAIASFTCVITRAFIPSFYDSHAFCMINAPKVGQLFVPLYWLVKKSKTGWRSAPATHARLMRCLVLYCSLHFNAFRKKTKALRLIFFSNFVRTFASATPNLRREKRHMDMNPDEYLPWYWVPLPHMILRNKLISHGRCQFPNNSMTTGNHDNPKFNKWPSSRFWVPRKDSSGHL